MNLKNKKYLIGTIIFSIAMFAFLWFSDSIFDIFIFLALGGYLILFITYIVLVVLGIIKLTKGDHIQTAFGLLLLFAMFFVAINFPFREAKVQFEYKFFTPKRIEVINKIETGEIPSDRALTDLPIGYRYLSSDGTVYVYENDEEGIQVGFWVLRGMLSGSMEVVYSSGGEDMIWKNETGHPIRSIEKLGANWYYVVTDY